MICAEAQDRLWEFDPSEGPDELRSHVDACAACRGATGEIARIRETLRAPRVSSDALAYGVMARMARPRRVFGGAALRYAAALLIGALAVLAMRPRPPESVRIVEKQAPPLHALFDRFANDPDFEETMIHVLNETLRRRSESAMAPAALLPEEVLR
jgi:hypothetical protein